MTTVNRDRITTRYGDVKVQIGVFDLNYVAAGDVSVLIKIASPKSLREKLLGADRLESGAAAIR